jgi:hypothetical protein
MKMYSILLASIFILATPTLAMDEAQKLQTDQQSQNTNDRTVSDAIMESSCCVVAMTALKYCCCGWIFLVNKCTDRSNNNESR